MKLKKCLKCGKYTFLGECCGEKTKDGHYKFLRVRDVREKLEKS